MFKIVHSTVWAFDCEWVPDPIAARKLHGLPAAASDADCLATLWRSAGATPDNPEPFVKPAFCRVVALAAVQRTVPANGAARAALTWRPRVPADFAPNGEAELLRRFLEGVGHHKPQLVGFNSVPGDLRVLTQRALVHGLCLPAFCRRPDKPWEGVDYFAKGGDFHVDLMDVVAGSGRCPAPSLNELATLCGIPRKAEASAPSIARLWLEGRLAEIVERNLRGAVTTYLLWLRLAHLGGFFGPEDYFEEQELVRALLADLAGQGLDVAARYLADWDALEAADEAGEVAESPTAYGTLSGPF